MGKVGDQQDIRTDLSGDEKKRNSANGIMSEEQWNAILYNDPTYDHRFIYAVKTTGIFCRPSCKSRPPIRGNVCTFSNAEQALLAGFRPCKRCKPTGDRMPDQEWVAQIIQCIQNHYADTLTLHSLAELCHGSPYHLQRTFKRIMGISPMEYIQHERINRASELLRNSTFTINDIAHTVGFPSTPYFITLFKKITGHTPAVFRKRHQMLDAGAGK